MCMEKNLYQEFDNLIHIEKRERDSHKGYYGKVLIVAGCEGMAGAALMCGKAALRGGAGLVRFSVPKEIYPVLQLGVPEATCLPREFEEAVNIHEYEAIALGPGLGLLKSNIPTIKKILNEYRGKLVIDADGLNCIMKYSLYGNLSATEAKVILTPHQGEAKRLLEVEQIEDDRQSALDISEAFNATVVMKGANTLVVEKDRGYRNKTGNPGMATGGSGDVLTGTVAEIGRAHV